jgi:carbonic anhydrase
MTQYTCQALIISCIDFRFQNFIDKWITENFTPFSFDRAAFAGGVKDINKILGEVEVSFKLHQIEKVVLINHEDCGAYGDSETVEKHAQDLKTAAEKIHSAYPNLEVKTFYLHLDGSFEQIV